VDIAHWLADVVMEEANVTSWCSCSVGKLENFGWVIAGGDIGLLSFVLLCADVQCCTTVGYSGWYGAVEGSLLDFVNVSYACG
jgi:hypothetical protein